MSGIVINLLHPLNAEAKVVSVVTVDVNNPVDVFLGKDTIELIDEAFAPVKCNHVPSGCNTICVGLGNVLYLVISVKLPVPESLENT
jgi:hypothetical protein